MSAGQPGLFDVPGGSPRPTPAGVQPDKRVTAVRFRSTARVLCGDCCRLIHQLGQAKAPLPVRARWRLVAADGSIEYLCNDHKDWRLGP